MRKIFAVFFSVLLMTPLLPISHAQSGSTYQFITHYEEAESEELRYLSDTAIEERPFDLLAEELTAVFELTRDVHIVTMECGMSNALYVSEKSAIILCYEFLSDLVNVFESAGSSVEDPVEATAGTAMFVFVHELGHALIDIYDIDVLAAEEDAADAFATLVLIWAGYTEAAFGAAQWWAVTATEPDVTAFADEHSLNQQRFYNILCLIYGSDPEEFVNLVEDDWLPESRAAKCPREYSQAVKSWDNQLSLYVREEAREPVEITFDKEVYVPLHDREAIITVTAPNANTMQYAKDAIDVYVWSSSDPAGLLLKFSETGFNTGIFSKAVQLKTMKLSPGDTITAEYIGSYGAIYFNSATITIGGTDKPEPYTPPVRPTFNVYTSDEYGFSIEYPTEWFVEDKIIQNDSWIGIVAFTPNLDIWDSFLGVALSQDNFEYKNLHGDQYLDKLIEDYQRECDSVSFTEEGLVCSDFEIIVSDVITEDELSAYLLAFSYSEKWPDRDIVDRVYFLWEIPIKSDTWQITFIGTFDDWKMYGDIVAEALPSFELLNDHEESSSIEEGEQAYVSVAMKHKKKVSLVSVKNNGDVEIFGVQIKTDDGKIRYVTTRGWDRDRIDQNGVMVYTSDKPIKPGKVLIIIMIVDNRTSSLEWSVLDIIGNMIGKGDVRPRS